MRSSRCGFDANATACMDLICATVSCVFDKKTISKHIIQSALEGVIRRLVEQYVCRNLRRNSEWWTRGDFVRAEIATSFHPTEGAC